ncbi:aminotransferase class V-fold PLP-dependent enzyme [Paraflavitalea sp. CAU 1676]|uniref:aminotransferase class V-fold PLP-dependent enzyme n=1 Tax=Paraflavitalea sp. CAU 1676 TaxID=3032598 RepID=UPI0023DAB8AD|nr:aminotransferase class V-fold PLP-dependent enzyme [Paraflavitalea sp. CAU 1676]MDF2191415.1 aminotransferase class V-fold PLP-dependent enzyme [Paraflavitalea sp. CAU 1676]
MLNLSSTLTQVGSVFSDRELQQFRRDTPGAKRVIHFNNAGAGLMPDSVLQVQLDHLQLEATMGGYEAAAWQGDLIKAFYTEAGLLFNCRADQIAFTASATDAYTRALSSIPFEKGDVILTDRDDFVSNQIQFLSLQKRLGVVIVHIDNAALGGVNVQDLEAKLHRYRPRLLAITHVPTNSGLVQPVEAIAAVYRSYVNLHPGKTWYILDACQSAGQMKLDVQALGCDFLSVTCRKFLRGPRGTGALYISDNALRAGLEPLFIDMRGAEWTSKDRYRQQPDAKRFEDWEFNYATVIGTMEAIAYCRSIGEDRIWQQVQWLSGMMREALGRLSRVRVLDRGPVLGGLVTFHIAGGDPVETVQALHRRKINVVPSYRAFGVLDFDEKGVGWAIRASPHYYNTKEEIDRFMEAIETIVSQ